MFRLLVLVLLSLATTGPFAAEVERTVPANYDAAIELIHAYRGSGSGDELERVSRIISELSSTHPTSGYVQALRAEMLSTWWVDQRGDPPGSRDDVLALVEEALKLNPRLALPYLSKARVYVRLDRYDEATKAIDAALERQPGASGAYFLRAEIYRRSLRFTEAETWYLKFIDSASTATRKSNGYGWMITMFTRAACMEPARSKTWLAKIRAAHEHLLRLDPDDAWTNVNFAAFLNGDGTDFVAAASYARKALASMEFPRARYHYAAALYQQLWSRMAAMNAVGLTAAIAQVAETTGVTLEEALAFQSLGSTVNARLQELQTRAPSPTTPVVVSCASPRPASTTITPAPPMPRRSRASAHTPATAARR